MQTVAQTQGNSPPQTIKAHTSHGREAHLPTSLNPDKEKRAHNAFAICSRLHRNKHFDCASSIPTGILSMPVVLPPFWLNRHLVLIKLPKKKPPK